MTNIPLNSVFDRMLTLSRAMDDAAGATRSGGGATQPLWLPAIDLYETEHAFVIDADLPGMRADQLELHFEQNTLTLKGTRESALPDGADAKTTRIFSLERPTGSFTRSIRLPEYVDGERIDADFADGVLRIRVPKASSALPRKIAVKVGSGSSAQARQVSA